MLRRMLIAAMLVGLAAAIASATEQDGATMATLCEVIKEPERFDGRNVQLHATINPGIEDSPTVLFDRCCSAVVAVLWPEKEPSQHIKEYQRLRRLMRKQQVV